MQRNFFKYHGIGNDYIYFDCFDEPLNHPAAAARRLSDRHFSIGGDGIVLILPSDRADAKMRMFNADGSEGKMCGNAIRCVAKFLQDERGVKKRTLTVETKSGIKTLTTVRRGRISEFTVDMGKPVLSPDKIPARFEGETIVDHPLLVGDKKYRLTCVSMGNPHCVVFEDPNAVDLGAVGPLFEHHPAFPERVNTEFVHALGRDEIGVHFEMRVWERGSGETLACGTGACAAAVAAVLNGFAAENEPIFVHLAGGTLKIVYTGKTVLMTGPAELAFTGTVKL